jgi:cytochrome c oxidase subunit IV
VSEHVVSRKTYFLIFAALMVGTVLTVAVAFVDLGLFNDVVMLSIAVAKALLVILFFMHVRYSGRLTALAVASGFLFLFILMGIVLADYIARGPLPGV